MIRKFLNAMILLATVACSLLAQAQTQPDPWSAMALRDLRAIHDTLRDNHPGPVDPENRRYAQWLEDGLVQASERARAVRSYSDYTRVLRFYTNGFQDGHLGVGFNIAPQEVSWAGFIVGPNDSGDAQVVYAASDSGVKPGEQLLSCDGKSIDALMKERVDPYFWNSAIPHQRPLHYYRLLQTNPDDQDNILKTCRVSSGEVTLKWRRAPRTEFSRTLNDALGRVERDPELKQVNGIWFITLPTFGFSGETNVKKVRAILAALKEAGPELRKSTLVFDVRGNHGGDSAWGDEIASVVWSRDWVKYIKDGFDGTVDWRASAKNIAWMEKMVERQSKAGLPESAGYLRMVTNKMKASIAAGKPFARIEQRPVARTQPSENPVKGKVFLLTDGECASACLDFADVVRRLPGVTHIGLPTSADAIYIDNTNADLPSGISALGYSLKVYRNRVRGNNEWYEPQVRWPGGKMTDESLMKWINSLFQR